METELLRALYFKKYWEAKRLIAAGADVNARGQFGYCALHYAAMNTHTHESPPLISESMPEEMTNLLIAKGAEIDATAGLDAEDFSEATPLHCAAASGNVGVLQLLIAHGANVRAKTTRGVSSVVMAIEGG